VSNISFFCVLEGFFRHLFVVYQLLKCFSQHGISSLGVG
jgi:hypothetical protein